VRWERGEGGEKWEGAKDEGHEGKMLIIVVLEASYK
jgi:hypothetical protein